MKNLSAVKFRTYVVLFLITLTFFSSSMLSVKAIGAVIDQQCGTTNGLGTVSVGNHEPIGQTFTPTQSNVVGFSIYIRSQNGVPTPMTAKILAGGIGGSEIGSMDFIVPEAFGSTTNGAWFSVSFNSSIAVTPGNTYALDLTENLGSAGIRLYQCSDSYAGGNGYSDGTLGISSYTFTESAQTAVTVTTTSIMSTSVAPMADFAITSSGSSISITPGGVGSVTIIVVSLNGFNSSVSLTASWIGSAPAGVSASVTSPVIPTSGSSASSPLTVTASSVASTGTFTIRVIGVSGSLTHTVAPDITVQISAVSTSSTIMNSTTTSTLPASPPPSCAVAISTFGSEVAPLVQGLRVFRDNSIMKTRTGSAFMIVFNAWYYSFSPNLAHYLGTHQTARSTLKYTLYPLIGILYASYYSYLLVSPLNAEAGAVVAGIVGAGLLGLIYMAPIGYIAKRILQRRAKSLTLSTIYLAGWVGISVAMVAMANFVSSSLVLGIVTANLALSMLSLGAILGTKILKLPKLEFVSQSFLRERIQSKTDM